jgi:hypothetical protein
MATFTTAALAASKYHAMMKMEALPKKQSGGNERRLSHGAWAFVERKPESQMNRLGMFAFLSVRKR